MKKSYFLLFGIPAMFMFSTILFAGQQGVGLVRQAIAVKGAEWSATENWITRLSPKERQLLGDPRLEKSDFTRAQLLDLPKASDLPDKFDWRDNNGNWLTPIKDQMLCSSCAVFSAIGQMESMYKINHNDPNITIDLSEQFILSCMPDGSCSGGYNFASVLEFLKTTGVPREECLPYAGNDQLPCSNACPDWQDQVIKIPGFGFITLETASVDIIKNAVYVHPVSCYMTLYTDFYSYAGGVYQHVIGDQVGSHRVLIVGWNDAEQSWICKNSWGEQWGEKGYFRIKWGDCSIGSDTAFIWDAIPSGPALALQQNDLDLDLIAGDSLLLPLALHNQTTTALTYSVINREYIRTGFFHPDTFNAWKGRSWWCGNPLLRGYANNWMQYLDTPLLDLSGTLNPRLTFMGFMAVEAASDSRPPAPYDNWDGCNVWVSVDGGKTFQLLTPDFPGYNSNSLYSFGPGNYDLSLGPNIHGWSGKSNGWLPAAFDLTPFKSKDVVIRFGFASDMGWCTVNDPSLLGFFVDDIQILDQSKTLFSSYADAAEEMRSSGYSPSSVEWLSLRGGFGQIAPKDSGQCILNIKTGQLQVGGYSATLSFVSNDTTSPRALLRMNLNVKTAATGVTPNSLSTPVAYCLSQNYPNPFNPSTSIEFTLLRAAFITLKVYNLLGEEVATLAAAQLPAGKYARIWDAKGMASGVYLYQLHSDGSVQTKKLLLMR